MTRTDKLLSIPLIEVDFPSISIGNCIWRTFSVSRALGALMN